MLRLSLSQGRPPAGLTDAPQAFTDENNVLTHDLSMTQRLLASRTKDTESLSFQPLHIISLFPFCAQIWIVNSLLDVSFSNCSHV